MKNKIVVSGMVLLVFGVAIASALPPKAKSAEGSVRAEIPAELIEFFEARGVDLSNMDEAGRVSQTTARQLEAVYNAEDSAGDRINGGRVNGMASRAMSEAYRDADAPVYLEIGPLYWGYWKEKDGLNESDQ